MSGSLLWHHGAAMSDVTVSIITESTEKVEDTPKERQLKPPSLILKEASTFFKTRLSPPWNTSDVVSLKVASEGELRPWHLHWSCLHRSLRRWSGFNQKLLPISSRHSTFWDLKRELKRRVDVCTFGVDLLEALGLKIVIIDLSRECIRKKDMAALTRLKNAYPLSSFFSDATGGLSSSRTCPSPTPSTRKLPMPPNPTNSMTIEDLGVLIAKSSTRDGLKYVPFVQTELQENERLFFHSSNGLALIQGFETVLMDLELQREKLVREAILDRDRLEEFEQQIADEEEQDNGEDDDDSDEDDNGEEWRNDERVNRFVAAAAAAVAAPPPLQPQPVPAILDAAGLQPPPLVNDQQLPPQPLPLRTQQRHHRNRHRPHSPTRRERHLQERTMRLTKIRRTMESRRIKREKALALLKHDYIMRCTRLFKLFGFAGGSANNGGNNNGWFHKIVLLDSFVSTGHTLFCDTIEPVDVNNGIGRDVNNGFEDGENEIDSDEDSESSDDVFDDLDEGDDSDDELNLSDSDGGVLDDDEDEDDENNDLDS
ncbi:UNVERIFIED_CONTAM: hypothetical protein HDU68_001291 [Siphonaria sp. JEL0065]|nr:hypothetical protein HDU68_001291 [Siphonaria sp. JEL0065]